MNPFGRFRRTHRAALRPPGLARLGGALFLISILSGFVGNFVLAGAKSMAQGPDEARSTRFNIKRYARMPGDTGLVEARRAAEEMFPVGSSASTAEQVLKASGAACNPGRDSIGLYIFCSVRTRQILLVSTDWRVVIYTSEDRQSIKSIFLGRENTGP
ncbi:MAG: hypothetical protein WA840_01655 [Caulobacteraceae bacterium]